MKYGCTEDIKEENQSYYLEYKLVLQIKGPSGMMK